MFRRILRYPAQMCLYDVVSVEERHLTVGFNPDLTGSEYKKPVRYEKG